MYTMTGSNLSVPEGDEYDAVRWAIKRISQTFPDELSEITQSRIDGWIAEIDSGTGRSADDIRDDIFKYVVGAETIMNVLGVDADGIRCAVDRAVVDDELRLVGPGNVGDKRGHEGAGRRQGRCASARW